MPHGLESIHSSYFCKSAGHKKAPPFLKGVARVTGLEPATSGVTGRRSNHLSYTRSLVSACRPRSPWDGDYVTGYA